MYCNIDDIKNRMELRKLLELTQTDNTSNEINEDIVNTAITDATDRIDDVLSLKYVLPLQTVPPQLTRLAVDIAKYYIYKYRYDNDMPSLIKESYNDAILTLSNLVTETFLEDEKLTYKYNTIILTNTKEHDLFFSSKKLKHW